MERDFGRRFLTGVLIVGTIVSCILGGKASWSILIAVLVLQAWREMRSAMVFAYPRGHVVTVALFAFFIVAIPATALLSLGWRNGAFEPGLLLGWFALVWTNDTAAYLVGRWLGRTAIAPRLSEGKTWEGWCGGFTFAVLLGAGVLGTENGVAGLDSTTWVGLAVVVSVLGPAGDFLESALKRKAGIKDSGSLLPGHGGVLDRFDSHFFAAPVAALILQTV